MSRETLIAAFERTLEESVRIASRLQLGIAIVTDIDGDTDVKSNHEAEDTKDLLRDGIDTIRPETTEIKLDPRDS